MSRGSLMGGEMVLINISGGWFVSQTDAHLAAPFRLCFNAAQPEGHIPLLASTEQIEL